jgi:hypothetical protein
MNFMLCVIQYLPSVKSIDEIIAVKKAYDSVRKEVL